jgi:hypothetical protein
MNRLLPPASICLRFVLTVVLSAAAWGQNAGSLKVHIQWGYDAPAGTDFFVKTIPATAGLKVEKATPVGLEPGESLKGDAWVTRAGGGDIDGIELTLSGAEPSQTTLQDMHIIWADTIAAADPDTARRLGQDAATKPGSPRLTVQVNAEGTRGFTVTADQLRTERAFWIPSLYVFVTAGDEPVTFEQHQQQLAPFAGRRILDRVHKEPEATYAQYTALWEDMGSPSYIHPNQPAPGHIVGLTWDSAIPKFGIDRGAGVWNDYGNPDKFRFWFDFGDLTKGIAGSWKGQHLQNGLPVMTTTFEKDGTRYEVEQFAYPLDGPPKERRGDIAMVLLERLRVTDLTGHARTVPVTFAHRRLLPEFLTGGIGAERTGDTIVFRDNARHRALLSISGAGRVEWSGVADYQHELKRIDGTLFAELPANGSRDFIVKLASPSVVPAKASTLQAIDYAQARQETLDFWSAYIARGAQFRVPDQAVNEMFNASLWHALRLPRRHGGSGPNVAIDLPYSNFAYSQTGTPWPVNQAVLVDYMLYDLRGYHAISTEELVAQFRNNQEHNGHINGLANWVVYTPGMLYAVAKNYLLSGDRAAFEALLPQSLQALDWCLAQISAAASHSGTARGLVAGPVNDLTGEGIWAFNQAYMYAGLDLFAQALEQAGHARATEARAAARQLHDAVQRGFGAAAMLSPLVQLRDHTWQPYVPAEATTPRRLLDVWYPTDVDCGAVHMIRLGALPPRSQLSDWLLNDHEDNLYYKGRGIANEPVYNQNATAYLLRDDPEAAIRIFYSYMASGFSHSVYEPVEHRYTHGQYFGPPSTDGTWFELYRNMLVREQGDGSLLIGQAVPRAWLADGKRIEVDRAPTYYGPLGLTMISAAASGRITAEVTMPTRGRPRELLVRLRHPDGKGIRSVTVNGSAWTDFDTAKEWVRIPQPASAKYTIVAAY